MSTYSALVDEELAGDKRVLERGYGLHHRMMMMMSMLSGHNLESTIGD